MQAFTFESQAFLQATLAIKAEMICRGITQEFCKRIYARNKRNKSITPFARRPR
ncbi:MAG: hypothetical protein RL660_52 [Bacteroidota bacterium]|jgi:hypothetical protein